MAQTLKIRKKSSLVWEHETSDFGKYILSKLYIKIQNGFVRVIEQSGRQRAEYLLSNCYIADDTQGGVEEQYPNATQFAQRLEVLEYIGFEYGVGGGSIGWQPNITAPVLNGQSIVFNGNNWVNGYPPENNDVIIQNNGYVLSGSNLNINSGLKWRVNNNIYTFTNIPILTINIPLADTGMVRNDVVWLGSSNLPLYVQGTEVELGNPETPPFTIGGLIYLAIRVTDTDITIEVPTVSGLINDEQISLYTTWSSAKLDEAIKGDRLNGNPTIVLVGNGITISGLSWWIQGIPYILLPPFTDTINYTSASGYVRKDIIVTGSGNNLVRIQGVEGTGIVQPPQVPMGSLLVTELDVYHDSVGEPTTPVIGDGYISKVSEKWELQTSSSTQSAFVPLYVSALNRNRIIIPTGLGNVSGVIENHAQYPNPDKPCWEGMTICVWNKGTSNTKLLHNYFSGSSTLRKFILPNGTFIDLKPNEVATFRRTPDLTYILTSISNLDGSGGDGGIMEIPDWESGVLYEPQAIVFHENTNNNNPDEIGIWRNDNEGQNGTEPRLSDSTWTLLAGIKRAETIRVACSSLDEDLEVGLAGIAGIIHCFVADEYIRIVSVRASVSTAPTGSAIQVQVAKNNTFVQGVEIATNTNISELVEPTALTYTEGQRVGVRIQQVGSTTKGKNLQLIFKIAKA